MEAIQPNDAALQEQLSFDNFRNEVLSDYRIACESRETSLLGRKEVLTGKAKFGIFGDGKEVAQVALAKFFKPGDFRSGYYRDQTLMFATGIASVEQYFAQLFADPDINNDPFSAGRQMNAHFDTQMVDAEGNWLDLTNRKNTSSDMAPTAGQMPRALGLALASKLFRNVDAFKDHKHLSNNGNEVCFCTIGDASTSEGHFWEVINAAGVQQVPLAVFVWDDGYGISVPKQFQTTKGSISEALSGFQKKEGTNGVEIYKLKGWDYAGLCEVFEPAIQKIRDTHTPAIFHIEEITQPQGHSTSGSHERYKTRERLAWEKEWDCIKQMKQWIEANALANEEELNDIEMAAKHFVKESKQLAWEKYTAPVKAQSAKAVVLMNECCNGLSMDKAANAVKIVEELASINEPMRRDVMKNIASILDIADDNPSANSLKNYYTSLKDENKKLYNSFLYNEGPKSALKIPSISAYYEEGTQLINGDEVLNKYFDALFSTNNKVTAFGEDVGYIGDVNQGFSGLQ